MLRTPTILPNIRISWDYHPTFMLISGRFPGLSPTYEQAHVGLDLLTLVSYHIIIYEAGGQSGIAVSVTGNMVNKV